MKRQNRIIIWLLVFFGLGMIYVCGNVSHYDRVEVTASDSNPIHEKLVVSVQVEKNSSLWDYAEQYYTEEYESMDAMIREIKQTNGLSSDTIHAGSYLLIPYYE